MSAMSAWPYEPFLRWGFLRAFEASEGDFEAKGGELFDLLQTTKAEPLWRRVGRLLAGALLTPWGPELRARCLAALEGGLPAWRLRALSAALRSALLERLRRPDARARVAAAAGLSRDHVEPAAWGVLPRYIPDNVGASCSTCWQRPQLLRAVGRLATLDPVAEGTARAELARRRGVAGGPATGCAGPRFGLSGNHANSFFPRPGALRWFSWAGARRLR